MKYDEAEVFLDNPNFWLATVITAIFFLVAFFAGEISPHPSLTLEQIIQIAVLFVALWAITFVILKIFFYFIDKEEKEQIKKLQKEALKGISYFSRESMPGKEEKSV